MAGLPHATSSLISNERVSFLRRATQHRLGNVSTIEASVAIRRTIEGAGRGIDNRALELAAEASMRYPYLIQLIGFRMWVLNPSGDLVTVQDA